MSRVAYLAIACLLLSVSPIGSMATVGQEVSSESSSVCDTGQWTSYIGDTQSPMPKCFTSKASNVINVPFPALNGIGDTAGRRVPIGDLTHLQFAQDYVGAVTLRDNTHQEIGLAVNFLDRTGGGGLPQNVHNQKVALDVFALGVPGGSNIWALNTDLHVNSGFGNYFAAGREADHTNFNGDYKPGGCPASSCPAGQINSNFFGDFLTFTGYPITAGSAWTGNPNPESASMHYGMLFQNVRGYTAIGTGLVADVLLWDSTNARTSLRIDGHHTVGLDTTQGSMLYAAAFAAGQNECFDGLRNCIVYDAESQRLRYNTARGAIFSIDSAGNTAARSLALTPVTVADLPLCDIATQDRLMVVSDATSPSYRKAVNGGGSIRTPVYCDGIAWTAH